MQKSAKVVWRSYKVFFFSGKVKSHTNKDYTEIILDESGNFTLIHSQNKRNAAVYKAEQWRVESIKARKYIYFGKMQAYEIINFDTRKKSKD